MFKSASGILDEFFTIGVWLIFNFDILYLCCFGFHVIFSSIHSTLATMNCLCHRRKIFNFDILDKMYAWGRGQY